MAQDDCSSPGLIFVGGVPRSGTSLVQKILDLHPEVYGGPEMGMLYHLMSAYRQLSAGIDRGKLSMVLDQAVLRDACRSFILSLYQDRLADEGQRFISEKTPENILIFHTLANAFPSAKFIWVIRDPRDVLCSLRAVQKRGRDKSVSVPRGRWLHEDMRLIRNCISAGEEFRCTHPQRLHLVHYEDLVANPRPAAMSMCRFVGIDFDERMLATEQQNDVSEAIASKRETHGVFYTNEMFDRPIDESSTGKWKRELDTIGLRAIQVTIAGIRAPSMARYDLGAPGRAWNGAFAVSEPLVSSVRAVTRRFGS